MAAPGSFILLSAVLLLLFGACLVAAGLTLYFGWKTKKRWIQCLSALPLGFGLFVIGPLLLLALGMVIWWFSADWSSMREPDLPPPPPVQQPGR